jgi:monoamine oxidase
MARAGTRILDDEDYLTPDERKRRAKLKQNELIMRGLTPDWFAKRKELCLPPGMRVAVIGAGFAGLAAAWYLKECGVQTTLYEASGRVGGRVRTDRSFVPGKIVEEGAELIGENHPLWGILAQSFSLNLKELTGDDVYENNGLRVQTRFLGTDLTQQEKKKLKASLRDPLAKICGDALLISETEPWRSNDAKKFDAKSVKQKLDELLGPASVFARPWLEFTLANDNCANVDKQSYLGLLAAVSAARMGDDPKGMLGYWMSTETHRCIGGNDLLADRIIHGLSDLRLRTFVRLIKIEHGFVPPVQIVSVEHDSSGTVTGHTSEAYDFAVLAAPPTVWGAITIAPQFNPASRAIQQGPAVKFLSRYDTRSWEQAPLIPPGLTQPLAPSAKWDELGSVWEGTDNQGSAPEFDLTVFSGGPFVQPASAYPLRMSLLYPAAKPKAVRLVDWMAEPFIETSYAIPGIGQVTTISKNQILPHADRLYFAGEQTSSGFFGYMEGALQSGARAARDIVMRSVVPCVGGSRYSGEGGKSGGGGSSDDF